MRSSSNRLATTRSLITAPPSRLEEASVDSFISVPPFTGGQTRRDFGEILPERGPDKKSLFYYNTN